MTLSFDMPLTALTSSTSGDEPLLSEREDNES